MTAVADREAKAERIEIRLTPTAKALLSAAAQVRHTSLSDFILSHAIAAAEQAVSIPRSFFAREDVWTALQQMLDDRDQTPTEATITWLRPNPKKQ